MSKSNSELLDLTYTVHGVPLQVDAYFNPENRIEGKYDWFDLFTEDGQHVNEGAPMHTDDDAPPTEAQVVAFVNAHEAVKGFLVEVAGE